MDRLDSWLIKPVKAFISITLLLIPLLLVDIIVERLSIIGDLFPLGLFTVFNLYIIFSALGLYFLFKHYSVLAREQEARSAAVGIIPDITSDQFNLTKREREVTLLLLSGNSYSQMCETLVVSMPTIKTHVTNIYRKTGTKNRMQLLGILSNAEN